MRSLMLWSYRHPVVVLALLLALSVGSALAIPMVRIDASSSGMMAYGDPAKQFYDQTMERFGSDKVTVVFVRARDLFSPDRLEKLEKLVYALEDLEGVQRVESLFSVTHFKGQDGFLESNPLLDYPPATQEEADEVKANALGNPLLAGNLISKDGMATAINLYLDPAPADPNFNYVISDRIEEVLGSHATDYEALFQIGGAYTWNRITNTILTDQFKIVPLSVACLLIMIVITMRTLSAGLLPMLTAGLSVLWTLGFMGIAGIPVTVLTSIFPALVIVIGSTEDTHMLSEYLEGVAERPGDRAWGVQFMAGRLGTAVLLTTLTTVFGFAAIMINDIIIVCQFGLVTTVAFLTNPIATFMATPVYLRYFGPRRAPKCFAEGEQDIFKRLGDKLVSLLRTRPRTVLWSMCGMAVLLGGVGLSIRMDNDILAYFKEKSEVRQRVRVMHDHLAGAYTLTLRIIGGQPGTFRAPENLAQIARFQDELAREGLVDKSTSLADYVRLLNREMNDGDPALFTIPDSPELIAQYLLFLSRDDIDRYVTGDFSEAAVVIRHNINSSQDLLAAVERMKAILARTVNPYFHAEFTGENLMSNRAAVSIASGQVKSLAILFGIMFIIMSIQFVSFKAGLLSLLPTMYPVALFYGLMALLDIPLNTGTCLVADIAIGIAVDDTIHLMTRYYKEMRVLQDTRKAVDAVIKAEIRPVISTSLALALGFGVLTTSQFVPIIQFGLLSSAVMIFGVIGDLFMTPILCTKTHSTTIWDMVSLRLDDKVIYGSKLFAGMARWQIKRVVLLGRLLKTPAGGLALTQGEPGHSMFLLLSGRGRVFVPGPQGEVVFSHVQPGDVFGEMALVSEGPRSANVQAEEDMEYVEVTWDGLRRIQRFLPHISSHLYLNLSRILGERLGAMNREACH